MKKMLTALLAMMLMLTMVAGAFAESAEDPYFGRFDETVVLRFVAEVGESDIYSGTRMLNHDLLLGLRKLGIECPYQQIDVHTN